MLNTIQRIKQTTNYYFNNRQQDTTKKDFSVKANKRKKENNFEDIFQNELDNLKD